MIFLFLTEELQGTRAGLAGLFLKADRGSAVMAAAEAVPYLSLALRTADPFSLLRTFSQFHAMLHS